MQAQKNSRVIHTALVEDGMIRCPKCRALLGKAYLGASAQQIELWCKSKECHFPVMVKI